MKNLIETIKIEDGEIFNLSYHQNRLNNSRLKLYKKDDILDLKSIISPPKIGLYRCRVIYNIDILKIEYIPYTPKKIKSIKIVHSDINYKYKYEDREELSSLIPKGIDEIIIVKDNLITDTTISNIALFDGKHWISPKTPLLNGTYRQKLIDEKKLKLEDINIDELKNYQKIAIINAMVGFRVLENINTKEII